MKLFLLALGAYLAGSVNFAIVLSKIFKQNDPRNHFSKNPGTFNVYRQLGIKWAAVVFLLDIGRSMGVAAAIFCLLEADLIPWVGLSLILGNRFPCFHGFKGGKGVANYLGFSLFAVPLYAGVAIVSWLITYAICRIPFVGSFVMVSILGIGYPMRYGFDLFAFGGVTATLALIYYGHLSNVIQWLQQRK